MRKLARQGHCHGILKTKIEFTILGQLQPNGTLRAMNFEKTDAKQAERVHGSADMDFVFASKLQTVRESGPEKPGPSQKLTGLCIARDCFTTLGKSQDRKNPGA